MSSIVFDSSAVLAAVNREPGATLVNSLISAETMISAVNAAEVYTKLVSYGPETAAIGIELLESIQIIPFTEEQAFRTGELRRVTRRIGLSLGDRACLALAIEVGADVYTADRIWSGLEVGCTIHLLREPPESVQ